MSNRNSRLPYNERAFSPQRMMNTSNMGQQGDLIENSSKRFQQAFYQLQSELVRNSNNSANQRNQNDFDSGWFRNESDGRRDDLSNQSNRGGYSGYDSSTNQNFMNSAFNNQLSNLVSSMSSSQDRMPLNSDLRYRLSNLKSSDRRVDHQSDSNYRSSDRPLESNFRSSDRPLESNFRSSDRPLESNYRSSDRPLESNFRSSDLRIELNYRSSDLTRSDFSSSTQQRSDYGSSSQQRSNAGSSSRTFNSAWESGQNAFDDRVLKRSERSRDKGRRDFDSKSSPQKPRHDLGNSRRGSKASSNSLTLRSSGRDLKSESSTNEVKMKIEKYPDIGEPKIKPRFADVFDLVKKEDNGSCIYTCKVCKIDCLPDQNIKTHLAGKKHKYFLKLFEDSLPGKTKFQKEKQLREVTRNKKSYDHKPMFEMIISLITQPLVALEYVVEVLDSKAREPLYFCILCEKRCDPRTIEKHLVSQTHRINYLTKHFTPISTQIQASRRFNEDLEFRQKVLMTICSRIENKFERSSAFVYEGHDFFETKEAISDNINLKKHVTIDDIPNAYDFLLEGIKLSDPKWESEHEPKPAKEPLEIPENVKRKRKVPEKVLEEYKAAVDYARSIMEAKLREYERDPDSHPKYKVEWELFWNKKIDEMSRRGEDSTNHSFHDEWCKFFVIRMRELHEDEMKLKADQIRRNLGLSKEDIGEKSDNPEPKRNRHANHDDDQGSFDEDFREKAPRIPKDVLYTKEKKIFNKFLHEVGIDHNKRPKPQLILVERGEPVDRTLPKRSPPRSSEPTTLITTCRLLSSLEKELGLLAQKVLDLLSKSIAYEREHSKSSDELLFENENLILIETVKEKIIGMQMTHLIAQSRTNAVEKAINEITKLIGQHEMMVSIRKTLKEMGKDEASPEEIEMLKAMFMKQKEESSTQRKRRRIREKEKEQAAKASRSSKK